LDPVKILIKRAFEFVEKLGAIIVKLHRKMIEYKSQIEKQSVPFFLIALLTRKLNHYFTVEPFLVDV